MPFSGATLRVLLAHVDGAAPCAGVPVKKVLLSSHSDTAGQNGFPAEYLFSGAIVDGNIVGRGAADMKFKVIYDLATLVWLRRLGVTPAKTVAMAMFPGEELGIIGASVGTLASPVIQAFLADAELAIDEGGGFTVDVFGRTLMPVNIGEKGVCWTQFSSTGTQTHGTAYVRPSSQAVVRASSAVVRLAEDTPAPHYTDVSRLLLSDMEEALTSGQHGAYKQARRVVRDLASPNRFQRAMGDLRKSTDASDEMSVAFLYPQLAHTYNVAYQHSYAADTLIPGAASVRLSAMRFPGETDPCVTAHAELNETIGDLVDEIGAFAPIGLDDASAAMLAHGAYVDPNGPSVSAFYETVRAVVGREMPDVAVVHATFQALSNCFALVNNAGIPCVGFQPSRWPEGVYYLDLCHSAWEYIPLSSFREGISVYFHTVATYASLHAQCSTSDVEDS
eukprot:TRINITY_DN3975_c0_g1_i1.p2 TRINITY_DN3975_c0_g1~~TRINITY_DN3975_c0_g1_i1.p2  ORF type:complete len:448 (+),score=122.54 TRINITY_DN3975_c0_g1_i1:461-1804(+)